MTSNQQTEFMVKISKGFSVGHKKKRHKFFEKKSSDLDIY